VLIFLRSQDFHDTGLEMALSGPTSFPNDILRKEQISDSMCYCAASGHNPRACGAVGERTGYA